MIPPAAFFIGIFILGILWLFVLAFSGSRRIPPTHETTGLLHTLVIVTVSVSCVLFVHALMFWRMAPYSSVPNLSRIIAIIIFALFALIPAGLFGLPVFQWLSLKSQILNGDLYPEGIAVAKIIATDLTRNMEERISVRILATREPNISPFVFGFPCGPVWLALPSNFDDMCFRACSGDTTRRDALIRLILSHELSHISSRDLLTLPLIWSYYISMLATSCFLWLFVLFIPTSPYQQIILPLAILMLASAAVGLLMRYRILKARESLADANATLAVDPVILNQLIAKQANGKPSALEAFLFLVSLKKPKNRTLRWSFLNKSEWFPHMAPIRSDTLQSLRALSASRGELLRGRTHLLPGNPLSFFSAIITASVLAAFLWWVCARMKTGLILLNNIQSTAKGDWLVHSFGTDWHLHKSLISAIFTTLTPVLSGIVMVTALLLPFRDIFFEGIRLRRVELGKLLGVSLLAAILSGVIVSFLDPIFIRPLFRTIYLIPSTIPYCLSVIVACVLFLVFVIVKWAPLLSNIRCLARRFIPMLFMMFLPLIISVLFFDQISILARIILFVPAAMAVSIPHSLISKPNTDTYIASEWLEYERIIFYKRIRLKTPAELNLFDMSDIFAGILRGAITITIPILLVMLIAYPLLLKFDNWFVSNLPILQEKVVELNKIPIDVARNMKWQIVQKYLGPYILLDLQKAFGWKASSIILGISLVLLTIPFFGALIFRLYQDAENRLAMLERYPILFNLYTIFQLPAKDTIRSSYISTVNSMISTTTPFLNGPENVPRMRATCNALVLLGDNIPTDKSEAMSAWLLACASSSGGFGYAPDMQPDPLHTYHAVNTLIKFGLLSAANKALHCRWAENQIINFLESHVYVLPSDSLRKISLLIRSFVLLSDEKINIRLVQQIDNIIPQLWQKSNQTTEDMANTLHSLQALGLLEDSPIADDIRSGQRLAIHEARVISSDPKNNLPEIEALVEIEAMLFPADYQTRPCVLQIQDIISKTKFFRNRP